MNRVVGLVVLYLVVCPPGLASEPGQPLDCSDWIALEPGYSCSVFMGVGEVNWNSPWIKNGSNLVADNLGSLITVQKYYGQTRTSIVHHDGTSESVVGFIEDRDNIDFADVIQPRGECARAQNNCPQMDSRYFSASLPFGITFDSVGGRLLVPLVSSCVDLPAGPACPGGYAAGWWIAAIDGFAPLLEIFQSYEPITGPLSFVVPTHPEGFQYADYFETFWGDLATVGNWSEAQPLQCGYPSATPSVGDYLTVDDTLPTPAPGQGYYFVTAVNYQGQRRYGRQSNGGVLAGRDPAVLPICE